MTPALRRTGNLTWAALSAALVLAAAVASAEPFPVPEIPNGEVREYNVRRVDKKDFGIKTFMRPGEETDSISVVSRWRGEGGARELVVARDDLRHRGQHGIWEFVFAVRGKTIVSKSYSLKIVSPGGRLLRSERAEVWSQDGGEAGPRPDIVHPIAISEVLRGMNFRDGGKSDLYIWNPEGGESPRMILNIEGLETVTVPAGNFRAWRVDMALDTSMFLGKWRSLDFLVNLVMPTFTFWFSEKPGHPLVRFEGQFGPKTSAPIEIHELTRIGMEGENNDP